MSLNQEKMDKWKSALGQTGSKADFLSEYAEHHNNEAKIEESSNLLPIAMKIAAKTIGQDLVTVAPIGGGNSRDEMKKIEQEVKIENRDRKINAVIEGEEYKEMKPEDHTDYKESKGPTGHLFYLDYKYAKKRYLQ